MIEQLIDKQDVAEIVRDKIAEIISAESTSQQALAAEAGHTDTTPWGLSVYTERKAPWSLLKGQGAVVNVWWDSSHFNSSGNSSRQAAEAEFHVDVYARADAAEDGTGHLPSDESATRAVQSAARLVRNIITAEEYHYLGIQGVVLQRQVSSVTTLQPDPSNQNAAGVMACRVTVKTSFNEFSPQATPSTLEHLAIDLHRASDGQIIAEADFDYSTGA